MGKHWCRKQGWPGGSGEMPELSMEDGSQVSGKLSSKPIAWSTRTSPAVNGFCYCCCQPEALICSQTFTSSKIQNNVMLISFSHVLLLQEVT